MQFEMTTQEARIIRQLLGQGAHDVVNPLIVRLEQAILAAEQPKVTEPAE